MLVRVGLRRRGLRRDVDPGQLALGAISHGLDLGDARPGLARELLRLVSCLACPAQPVHDDVSVLGFRVLADESSLDSPAIGILRADLRKAAGILLEIFVNPLNLVAPIWPLVGVLLPVVLLQIGELAMARRSWPIYLLLVLPIAMALVAAGYKKYPLHGRLMLELVPAFFLLIAEGTEWLGQPGPDPFRMYCYTALLILLLAYPCLTAVYNATAEAQSRFQSAWRLAQEICSSRMTTATRRSQNVGITICSPPLRADSWAQSPTMVQLAEVSASGRAGRSPRTALRNAWTR